MGVLMSGLKGLSVIEGQVQESCCRGDTQLKEIKEGSDRVLEQTLKVQEGELRRGCR